MSSNFPYRCRNDFVLVRVVDLGKTESGIALPNMAMQGKEFHVVSVGPKVQDLHVGDKVFMIGTKNSHYFELPQSKDLIIIKEEYAVLVDRAYGTEKSNE